jgi:cell wall-associated NlpC family hydrolase
MTASIAFGVAFKSHYSSYHPFDGSAVWKQIETICQSLSQRGTATNDLDCSGFVRLVYDQVFGIDLPHSSLAQFSFTTEKNR